jgi:Na+-driven multidrug efflux pump
MKNINLLNEDIFKLFWKIALPSSIGTIFQNLYSLVDAIFAGRMISETALAAIGQTFPIYFVIIALGIGLSIATTSIIANSIGEKNFKKASNIFCQSLILAFIVGILISILGITYGSSILKSINDDGNTLLLSTKYMNVIYLGSIFILLLMVTNSCLAALGDTKSYRNVLIFSFLLNIILNPILISGSIFNFPIFKPLGIMGIALATILSQMIGLIYLVYKITKTEIYNNFISKFFIPKLFLIREILFQGYSCFHLDL